MGESLNRAISSSIKGYIDDYNDIDEIIDRLLNTTADYFNCENDGRSLLNKVTKTLMEFYDFPKERKGELTYGEMLCIIDEQRKEPYTSSDGRVIREEASMMLAGYLINILLSAEKTNATIKLFMSATVKGYLDYLDKKGSHSEGSRKHLFRRLYARTNRYLYEPIDTLTTVKKFLNQMSKYQSQGWNPFNSITEYEEKMRFCYQDLIFFMLDCFKPAFPEVFDFSRITDKYENVQFEQEDIFMEAV